MKIVVTDEDVAAWAERHDLSFGGSKIDARAAFEDAQTFAQTLGEPVAVPDGWMLFPKEAWTFLWGTSPLDGISFGDFHPNRVGLFWWRHVIQQMLSAAPSPPNHGEGI